MYTAGLRRRLRPNGAVRARNLIVGPEIIVADALPIVKFEQPFAPVFDIPPREN